LVAVDEHKAGIFGHHHNGQKLAAAQQRFGKLQDLPRPPDAGMGIGKLQLGDLDAVYGDRGRHRPALPNVPAKVPRVISLQDGESARKSLYPMGINRKTRFDA